jgi:hypothetical protein
VLHETIGIPLLRRFPVVESRSIWLTLAGRSRKGASFAGDPELIAHVDGFVAAYKNKADPLISRFSQSIHLRRVRISQGPQPTPGEAPDPAYPL